ncbi:MAG: hypothetical protein ACK40K_02025, partial [Raineya sp.]
MFLFKSGVFITLMVTIINTGFLYRNFTLFRTFFPEPDVLPTIKYSVTSEIHSFKSFCSAVIKNFGYNLTTTNSEYNEVLVKNIEGTHRLLGVDINDKRISFSHFEMPFHIKFYSQDYAPNPFHTWLFFILTIILYLFRERFTAFFLLNFLLGLLGFLLLIFMLKWQPFGTRFQ